VTLCGFSTLVYSRRYPTERTGGISVKSDQSNRVSSSYPLVRLHFLAFVP
jgi:hypothetical protein